MRRVRKMKVKVKGRPITVDYRKLKMMRKRGMTYQEIARKMKVSFSTIARARFI